MDLKIADDAIEAYDAYYRVQDQISKGRLNDLGSETRKRLVQVRKILQGIIALHDDEGPGLQAKLAPPKPADASQSFEKHLTSPEYLKWKEHLNSPEWTASARRLGEVGEELELQTECFYWVAGRARALLQSMPGLAEFDAVGLRGILSLLNEEPHPDYGATVLAGIAWGTPSGPIINVARWSDGRTIFEDSGLYPNAEEFFNNLRTICTLICENPKLLDS
jgi:hypothetical protein